VEPEAINIHHVIDHERIGRIQWIALAIYTSLMMFDGYNTQVIRYIVPVLAHEWGLPKSIFGSIFSAALVGMLVGNSGGPFLTNRFGQKRMAIIATATLSIFTAATVFATNTSELITLRFLIGVGLGTVAPCLVSLTTECSPKRTRATFTMPIYVGYAIGFTVAGFCCEAMIPTMGWAAPMWVGGPGTIVSPGTALKDAVAMPVSPTLEPRTDIMTMSEPRDTVHKEFL
jgi:MFS transporter, AAHS family, 4-hydroxybenzoate transporter